MTDQAREPGLYGGILFEEYRRWPGFSQSRGKTAIERTPLRAHRETVNPGPRTDALRDGAAIHVATLQPTLFETLYPERPEGHANSNAFKAKVADIVKRNPFAEILPEKSREMALRCAELVRMHPEASLLLGRNAEQSAVWIDPDTGVLCKARLDDWLPAVALVDLKSTANASAEKFAADIWEYGYHIQAALYRRAAAVLNLDCEDYTFILVEKDENGECAVYRLAKPTIDLGDEWLDVVLPMWKKWEETGKWPGYRSDDISLPDWAMTRHRQLMERIG